MYGTRDDEWSSASTFTREVSISCERRREERGEGGRREGEREGGRRGREERGEREKGERKGGREEGDREGKGGRRAEERDTERWGMRYIHLLNSDLSSAKCQ